MKKFKFVIFILIFFAILILFYLHSNQYISKIESDIYNVKKMDVYKTLDIKGTIKGKEFVDVYSFARRKIVSIAVKEGDKVSVGDTLCTTESSYNETHISKAQLAVSDAKRQFDIAKSLYSSGDMSKNDYEKASSILKNAELDLKLIVEEKNVIESPISGTVTRMNAINGKIPLTTDVLFTIENIDQLELKLDVDEENLKNVYVGQLVRIKTKIYDEYIYGKIRSIALSGEEKKANNTKKIIPVYVDIDNSKNKILSGITGNAEIILSYQKDALALPIRSIIKNDKETFVYIVNNDVVEKCRVDILFENNEYFVIDFNENIKEGTKIIVSPDENVKVGKKVRIKDEDTVNKK